MVKMRRKLIGNRTNRRRKLVGYPTDCKRTCVESWSDKCWKWSDMIRRVRNNSFGKHENQRRETEHYCWITMWSSRKQVRHDDQSWYPPTSWVASLAMDSWMGHCPLLKLYDEWKAKRTQNGRVKRGDLFSSAWITWQRFKNHFTLFLGVFTHTHTALHTRTQTKTFTKHNNMQESTCHNSFQTIVHPSPPQNAHFTTVLNQ